MQKIKILIEADLEFPENEILSREEIAELELFMNKNESLEFDIEDNLKLKVNRFILLND